MIPQNDRLDLKRDFWTIRRAILDRFDYMRSVKLTPAWSQREPMLYGRRPRTITYTDAVFALPQSERTSLLWHCLGLALYEDFCPESAEEEAILKAADSEEPETKRIKLFLSGLSFRQDEPKADRHGAASVATQPGEARGA